MSLIRQGDLPIPMTYGLSVQVSRIRQCDLMDPNDLDHSLQLSWIRQRDLRILNDLWPLCAGVLDLASVT
jgi:hypothetical protein